LTKRGIDAILPSRPNERRCNIMANSTNGSPSFKGLDRDVIERLIAGGRSRNTYAPKLEAFATSDEAGISVREEWSLEFKDKNASTLYQGFMKAVRDAELDEAITVKQSDGEVYLLNMTKVAAA
jgi:hypothetical protein